MAKSSSKRQKIRYHKIFALHCEFFFFAIATTLVAFGMMMLPVAAAMSCMCFGSTKYQHLSDILNGYSFPNIISLVSLFLPVSYFKKGCPSHLLIINWNERNVYNLFYYRVTWHYFRTDSISEIMHLEQTM